MAPSLLAALAAALLVFGALSRKAERSVVTPPMVFVLLGVAMSEIGVGWLGSGVAGGVIHGLAELTLLLVLFTDAARIDLSCLRREGNLPARMLVIGLPLTIAIGTLVGLGVFPELGAWEVFLLAAILAPTDAALGQAVVSSPLLPVRIRQTLNVESGLNDGIALPIVLVAASMGMAGEAGDGVGHWLQFAGLQLLLGPLTGVAIGFFGGRLVERATQTGWMNDPFQRLSVLGLAALSFAAAELLGGNGFIAAFVAGLTVGNTSRAVCSRLHEFGEAEGQLLTLLVFLVFGGVMVPESLARWDGRTLVYAALSLTLVRMLPVAISLWGSGLRWPSVGFLGWFGPRGLASILFVVLVVEDGALARSSALEAVVVMTVLLSTFAHGISAYPLARRYGSFILAAKKQSEVEHGPASELPVRLRHVERGTK